MTKEGYKIMNILIGTLSKEEAIDKLYKIIDEINEYKEAYDFTNNYKNENIFYLNNLINELFNNLKKIIINNE